MTKFTNQTLLEHYLKDLELPDTTHGGRKKANNPQHWNIPSIYKTNPITLDVHSDPNIWVWSDIHFYHKNIIRYSERPYPNVDLMNKCLIGNYLNVVQPDDIVIWGGDISFGHVDEINQILKELPGYKIHIVGNHDMDRRGKLTSYTFDERHSCLVLDIVDDDMEYQMLITHYPLDIVPEGCINIHGHIHQHLLQPYNINVCVEHTNYTPMHIDVIREKARKYFKEIA